MYCCMKTLQVDDRGFLRIYSSRILLVNKPEMIFLMMEVLVVKNQFIRVHRKTYPYLLVLSTSTLYLVCIFPGGDLRRIFFLG